MGYHLRENLKTQFFVSVIQEPMWYLLCLRLSKFNFRHKLDSTRCVNLFNKFDRFRQKSRYITPIMIGGF